MPELSYETGEDMNKLSLLFFGRTGDRLVWFSGRFDRRLGFCYEELVGGIDNRTIQELVDAGY